MAAVTYTAQRGLKLLGDEKGAWLADTTEETITGSELVANGDFTTDATGWTAINATLSVSAGELKVTNTTTARGRPYQDIVTNVGDLYMVTATMRTDAANTTQLAMVMAANNSGVEIARESTTSTSNVTIAFGFVATSATSEIRLYVDSAVPGDISYFDNISVRRADPDLSTNNNGLGVYGTITKSAVAPGSELVAYSGFSESNYQKQSYNADMDFGTGDFCFMGWYSKTADGWNNLVHRGSPSSTNDDAGASISIASANNGNLTLSVLGMGENNSRIALDTTGTFRFFTFMRRSGTFYAYQDGILENSVTVTKTLADTGDETLFVGRRASTSNSNSWIGGSATLIRVLDYAPTAAQIKAIYESEKGSFNKYSTHTQVGESYSFDLPVQSSDPATSTVKTDNVSLSGVTETIVDRDDDELDITTGLLHRTDTTYTRISEFQEFMYGTRASEPFTLDLYGSVAVEDEPETYIRVGQYSGPTPESNMHNWFRGSFKVRKL